MEDMEVGDEVWLFKWGWCACGRMGVCVRKRANGERESCMVI